MLLKSGDRNSRTIFSIKQMSISDRFGNPVVLVIDRITDLCIL